MEEILIKAWTLNNFFYYCVIEILTHQCNLKYNETEYDATEYNLNKTWHRQYQFKGRNMADKIAKREWILLWCFVLHNGGERMDG